MNRSQLRYVLFMLVCLFLLRGTAVEASAGLMLTRASFDVYVYTVVCDRNGDDPTGYRFYDNDLLIGEAADLTAPSVIWSIAADDYGLHNIAVTAYRRSEDGRLLESLPTIISFRQSGLVPPQLESSVNNGPADFSASWSSPSPSMTEVPTNSSQIIDNSGAVWAIGSDVVILRNGTPAANGLGSRILWMNGVIYVLGLDGNWWQWTGLGWGSVGSSRPTGASPDGTIVFLNGGQIVDDNGAVWTIGDRLTIQRNGTWAAGGIGSEILWTREAIYAFGVDANWWLWTGNGWVNTGPTQP